MENQVNKKLTHDKETGSCILGYIQGSFSGLDPGKGPAIPVVILISLEPPKALNFANLVNPQGNVRALGF